MSDVTYRVDRPPSDPDYPEVLALLEHIRSVPHEYRTTLEVLSEEVLEQARFRKRAFGVARDALQRLRLDLEMTRFDLEATRRERDALRRLVDHQD